MVVGATDQSNLDRVGRATKRLGRKQPTEARANDQTRWRSRLSPSWAFTQGSETERDLDFAVPRARTTALPADRGSRPLAAARCVSMARSSTEYSNVKLQVIAAPSDPCHWGRCCVSQVAESRAHVLRAEVGAV